MAATIPELKRLLIQARFEKALATIPHGHCPNVYYGLDYMQGCNSDGSHCAGCKQFFKEILYKQIEKEVMAL